MILFWEEIIFISKHNIFADHQLKKLKILDFFKKILTIFRKVKPKRTVQLLSRLLSKAVTHTHTAARGRVNIQNSDFRQNFLPKNWILKRRRCIHQIKVLCLRQIQIPLVWDEDLYNYQPLWELKWGHRDFHHVYQL